MRKKAFSILVLFGFLCGGGAFLWAESDFAAPSPWEPAFGTASWYSESDPGINLTTANGEIFDDSQFTCASWDFPFGTWLRVTNLSNGEVVFCRVNDRGPAKRLGRLIDLTKSAFHEIAPLQAGLVTVKVEPLRLPLRLNEQINSNHGQ